MGEIREVFDVKQHPMRDGEISALEKRVQNIERRFAEIYCQEQVDRFSGFCTENGTRFFVNGIYEWQTVFLEYDDGEDGDMFPLDHNEETMFRELQDEIIKGEKL